MVVQKHKKIKDCTWWVLIADEDNRLLEMKKIVVKKFVRIKFQIDVPENSRIGVYLMADSYVGLDQFHDMKLW